MGSSVGSTGSRRGSLGPSSSSGKRYPAASSFIFVTFFFSSQLSFCSFDLQFISKFTSDLLFANNFKTIQPICTIYILNCREKYTVTGNFIFKYQLVGTPC